MHLYQPLCQVFFHHKVILSPWTFLDINGVAEVEGNHFNDTPAYDDNAHKAVLCAHSLIFCLLGYSLYIRGFPEVEKNNSNDTLACDDNAQKAVLCNHTHFLSKPQPNLNST